MRKWAFSVQFALLVFFVGIFVICFEFMTLIFAMMYEFLISVFIVTSI